jgi:hypothetical protein
MADQTDWRLPEKANHLARRVVMKTDWKLGVGLLAIILVIGAALLFSPSRHAVAASDSPTAGRYTVVGTDGTHLIVTDNKENKVYFYAIDQGGKPGDEMKLRGYANLEDVGKATIKPTTTGK